MDVKSILWCLSHTCSATVGTSVSSNETESDDHSLPFLDILFLLNTFRKSTHAYAKPWMLYPSAFVNRLS